MLHHRPVTLPGAEDMYKLTDGIPKTAVTSTDYWIEKALACGFSKAAPIDVGTLRPRQDVRDMCAADKCGAYGKQF